MTEGWQEPSARVQERVLQGLLAAGPVLFLKRRGSWWEREWGGGCGFQGTEVGEKVLVLEPCSKEGELLAASCSRSQRRAWLLLRSGTWREAEWLP